MNELHSELPVALLSPEQLDELNTLTRPLSEGQPCGPSMRFDPVFTDIRLAREEDDPSLPMGAWERPLKKADWGAIETRCKAVLARQSKDLQIAAWLAEAWTRQYGFDGLFRGLVLIERLVNRYWNEVHPQVDDAGDADARVAALDWVNQSLSMTVKVHVPLLGRAAGPSSRLTLADWERMTAVELSPEKLEELRKSRGEDEEAPPSRADLIQHARLHLAGDVERATELIRGCSATVAALSAYVDGKLGLDAPNMSKMSQMLSAVERVLTQLAPSLRGQEMEQDTTTAAAAPTPGADAAPPPADAPVFQRRWDNREEAYATLEAIADYLSRVEPHSPTPYLLRRAVNWGRMPLPELMAEIVREEGDLNRLGNILGLNS